MKSLILITATRAVTVLMLAFSLYLLIRGHNQPGGGFVGGLVAAAAILLHAIANGAEVTRRRLRIDLRNLCAVGIAVAIAAGLLGAPTGQPFLTGVWIFPGGLPLGSPLLFDVGVYCVVVGAVATLFLALEEET